MKKGIKILIFIILFLVGIALFFIYWKDHNEVSGINEWLGVLLG